MNDDLYKHLAFLYGTESAAYLIEQINRLIDSYQPQIQQPKAITPARLTERDAVLITYGDMVQSENEAPLHTLSDFLTGHVSGLVSTVHLLPFYPYSSDDGFSVIDYWAVNPELGTWPDVGRIGGHFRLMFDAVINHISAQSDWFQGFLQGDETFQNYFITVDPQTDLSQVFRPRTLPLLTKVETANGPRHVWTTFSDDQIDLNFANPEVALKIIELLLFYVSQGAELIRLDAIGFMWKEVGTTCIHLPQTHRLIQLMRRVLDRVAPSVVLITETNVPHKDNISYFGNGRNEAQMVYNFSLPPLTLHTFHTGSAAALSRWADSLTLPSDQVTFFNFLASHDGIGVTPARGILDDTAVTAMAERVQQLGGHVSYKNNPDGSQSAYELNINFLDALGNPGVEEPVELIARRFLASQAIMLALRGVPGIYFHSLFGSRGWPAGVKQSGRARTINRQKLSHQQIEQELADETSLRHLVFSDYANLLHQRTTHPAFHPNGEQEVIFAHEAVFALWRRAIDGETAVLCLHNVSNQNLNINVDADSSFTNLLDGREYVAGNGRLYLTIAPYEVLWLNKS
ncbi:MAG: sugar phosphorylase [Ardenticatenaceae bacterium]|nr:sugar phosphorylase [Ardenticatenaceae bacterium]MCB9445468.1 sugar phosphorylase [Ardenticatenaceae bacterium]